MTARRYEISLRVLKNISTRELKFRISKRSCNVLFIIVCVRMTSQNYWRPCWRTYVIKMATETTGVEPLMLSNYSENLEGKGKYRYLDKISEIGIDPLLIPAKTLSEKCLPPVESMDLKLTFVSCARY